MQDYKLGGFGKVFKTPGKTKAPFKYHPQGLEDFFVVIFYQMFMLGKLTFSCILDTFPKCDLSYMERQMEDMGGRHQH